MVLAGMPDRQRILIVDDDREIARLLVELLERHDYEVEAASNAASARGLLRARSFDLVICDVRMPGESGTDLCRQIRNQSTVPIIMLTAVCELTDRVIGLELGADDYITKPFEGRELMARIRAVMRRAGETATRPTRTPSILTFGEWRLDLGKSELRRASGALVPLSNAEFNVLSALAQRPNVVMSREWLAEVALGAAHCPGSRNIDVVVSRLRTKVRAHDAGDEPIETVRTGGYALRAPVRHLPPNR
jgi:two-component system OmpR family response regulator